MRLMHFPSKVVSIPVAPDSAVLVRHEAVLTAAHFLDEMLHVEQAPQVFVHQVSLYSGHPPATYLGDVVVEDVHH